MRKKRQKNFDRFEIIRADKKFSEDLRSVCEILEIDKSKAIRLSVERLANKLTANKE